MVNDGDITINNGYDELTTCPLCRHKVFKGSYDHEVYVNRDNELECSGEKNKRIA